MVCLNFTKMNVMKCTNSSRLSAVLLLSASMVKADTLSFKFQDTDDVPFGSDVVAGAPDYAAANWNFLQTDWSGNAENDAVLETLRMPEE